jgi:hypothetical protein
VSGSARLSGFLFPRPSWNCQAPLSLKHSDNVFPPQQSTTNPALLKFSWTSKKCACATLSSFLGVPWPCARGWALQIPCSYIDIHFHVHTHIHVHVHSFTHSFIHSFNCVLLCLCVFVCLCGCVFVCLLVCLLFVCLFGCPVD